MFPYKIRKPAWGSLKPKETRGSNDVASQLGGDPGDCHTIGGNLQRAMLLDMIELRQRYFDVEVAISSSNAPASTSAAAASTATALARGTAQNNNLHRTKSHHATLGSSFARFKACFRGARFGAIHTRTIPPRVDRGEYVQLLYSSCFHLLEESFKKCSGDNAESLFWENNNSEPSSAFNAIHAAFVLYSLHQTNVLPEAPPPQSHTKRTKSGKFDEQSLKEAWSMLPIGINSDEDKLYRRTYRSGVRIDRWNYLLLLRLRDICHARVDQCSVDKMGSATNNDTTAVNTCNNISWHCHCGLALDAAHVIDKMLFDDKFFEYCEYHGPHSLEGLAGSTNFYRAYFVKPPKKKSKGSRKNADPVAPIAPAGLSESKLNIMGDGDCIRDSLDLQLLSKMLESHRSNLSSVMGQLQKSHQPGGGLQPKQRELVENTLRGAIDPSINYSQMANKLIAEKDSNADETNVSSSKAEAKQSHELEHATPNQGLLTFPETFSAALCDKIRGSLFDFKEEADMLRKTVVQENKVRMKKDHIPIDFEKDQEIDCFDDFGGFDDFDSTTQQKSQISKQSNGDDLLPTTTDGHRGKKRQRELDAFLELQREEMNEDNTLPSATEKVDDASIATGAGKNALLSLLSLAEGNINIHNSNSTSEKEDEVSIATGAGKNALLSLLSMAEDNYDSEPLEDDSDSSNEGNSKHQSFLSVASVNSGMGKRALQYLLTQSATSHEDNKAHKTRAKTKAPRKLPSQAAKKKSKSTTKKKTPPATVARATESKSQKTSLNDDEDDGDISLNVDEEFSVATEDAGKNALASLLSKAKNAKKKMKPTTKKKGGTSARITESNTMRTSLEDDEDDEDDGEDDEDDGNISLNASVATGMSVDEEFSVATEGAGKNALASLLSQAKNIEQV